MDALLQDLRYAVRQLRKNPGFTTVAVITLALGVGVNTGVFSLANWVLLRPTPGVRDERSLATVYFSSGVSLPTYRGIAGAMPAFEATAGQDVTVFSAQIGREAPRNVTAGVVTPNYFSLLGVAIGPGSLFTDDEVAAATGAPVAIIGHALWAGSFASDPGIVGRTIRLNGVTVTIVGVAAQGFEGTARPRAVELWVPYTALAALSRPGPFSAAQPVVNFQSRGQLIFQEFVGRFAPGAGIEQASAQLRRAVEIAQDTLITNRIARGGQSQAPYVRAGAGVTDYTRNSFASTARVLAAVSSILLVLTVANLTNLLLFRATRRRDEMVVRQALGASSARLVRHSVSETLLLAIVGSAVSLLVAVGLVSLFRGIPIQGVPAFTSVPTDARVLGFGILVSLVIGVILGLVAPFLTGRVELAAALKAGSGKGSAARSHVRNVMTVIQLAACLSLLVGSFLLIRTLQNLHAVDLGFETRRLTVYSANPGSVGYTADQAATLFRDAMERIKRLPGVEHVAMAPMAPFGGGGTVTGIWKDAQSPGTFVGAISAWVSNDYFAALGLPIVRGRAFTQDEALTPPAPNEGVVIISTALARQLFGTSDPLGQSIWLGRPNQPVQQRVVGVVNDARWYTVVGRDMGGGSASALYWPLAAGFGPRSIRAQILVRASGSPAHVSRSVQAAMAELAPSVPLLAEEMTARVDRTLAQQRLFARVVGALTALAVVLAGVGLYGLVGFGVMERLREFGIRIALGAKAEEVLNLVVRQAAILTAIGGFVGIAGAIALSRLISSRLFGVTALEPAVYLGAVSVLVLIVLIASIIPARAATKVDPMIALRSE